MIVRRLVSVLSAQGYSLTFAGDDLPTALGNALVGLRSLIPLLLELCPVAGLVLHAGKTKVLNLSGSRNFDLRRRLAEVRWRSPALSLAVALTWASQSARTQSGAR